MPKRCATRRGHVLWLMNRQKYRNIALSFVLTSSWRTSGAGLPASMGNVRSGAARDRHIRWIKQDADCGSAAPPRLASAVLRALRQDMLTKDGLSMMEARQHVDEPDERQSRNLRVYDAITGTQLDPKLVAKAPKDEMKFVVEELRASGFDTVDTCKKNQQPTDTGEVGRREPKRLTEICCAITFDGGRDETMDDADGG